MHLRPFYTTEKHTSNLRVDCFIWCEGNNANIKTSNTCSHRRIDFVVAAYTCSNPGTAGYKSTTCASGAYQGLGVFCDPATAFPNGTTGLLIIGQVRITTSCEMGVGLQDEGIGGIHQQLEDCFLPDDSRAALLPVAAHTGIKEATMRVTGVQTNSL